MNARTIAAIQIANAESEIEQEFLREEAKRKTCPCCFSFEPWHSLFCTRPRPAQETGTIGSQELP